MIEGRLFCILPGCSSIWFSVKNNNLLVITPFFVDATFFITKDTICTVTGSKSCFQLSLHGWRLDTVPLSDAFGFLEVSACLVSLNSSFTASWYVEKDLPFEFDRFCRHGRQGEVLGQELVHTFCISDSCSLSEYSLAHFLLNVRPCCVLFPLCMWCLEIITLHSKAKVWKGAGQISHTVSEFILGSATIGKLMHLLCWVFNIIFEISMYEFLGLVDTVIILDWAVQDDKNMFFYHSRISISATDAIYCFHCMSMQDSYMQRDFGGIKKLRLNLVLLRTWFIGKLSSKLFSCSRCHRAIKQWLLYPFKSSLK